MSGEVVTYMEVWEKLPGGYVHFFIFPGEEIDEARETGVYLSETEAQVGPFNPRTAGTALVKWNGATTQQEAP